MSKDASHMEGEKRAFTAFLEACPRFAADVSDWWQPDSDPPDVVSRQRNGSTIEWEITECLHQQQTRAAIRRRRCSHEILRAIGKQPPPPVNVSFCYLFLTHPPSRPPAKDAEALGRALFALVDDVNTGWHEPSPARYYPQPGIRTVTEAVLAKWPPLDKYLRQIQILGRERREPPKESRWIWVDGRGGSSQPDQAAVMWSTIRKKIDVYTWPGDKDIRLLAYYDRALALNTPAIAPFETNAQLVAQALAVASTIPFNRIYLLFFHSREAFQVHPKFKRYD
jgi:hypothetical protein